VFVLDFHGRGALRSFLPPADVEILGSEERAGTEQRELTGATA
jgi:hypothetical protein